MKSSQRSENMNSYFDGYVNSTTPLSQFVEQYDNVVSNRGDKEEDEDLMTMTTQPDVEELHPLEAHAGKVCTRNIFNIFEEEFKQVFYCRHKKVRKEGEDASYEVQFTLNNRVVSHTVNMNVSNMHFKCSCEKFETWGILCKHICFIHYEAKTSYGFHS